MGSAFKIKRLTLLFSGKFKDLDSSLSLLLSKQLVHVSVWSRIVRNKGNLQAGSIVGNTVLNFKTGKKLNREIITKVPFLTKMSHFCHPRESGDPSYRTFAITCRVNVCFNIFSKFIMCVLGVTGLFSGSVLGTTRLDTALFLLVRQEYSQAKLIVNEHIRKDPSDMDALYLSFAIEQTRILDYESYVVESKQFQSFADSLQTLFKTKLPTLAGSDSVKCLFYCANVYGGIGLMHAKNGNWFDAVKNAVTSVTMLKQVRKIDPEFYAAYLGLGVFNYYLRNSFKWLPFVRENDDDGIKTVEIALKAEFPYDYAAKNSLCWMLIEQDQYKKADSLALSVLREVPDNTIFLRIRMMIALWTQQYETALNIAEPFVKLTLEREPRNWSDLVAGYAVLTSGYKEVGNIKALKDALQFILSQPIPLGYTAIPHVKKYLKQMHDMKQKYHNVKTNN